MEIGKDHRPLHPGGATTRAPLRTLRVKGIPCAYQLKANPAGQPTVAIRLACLLASQWVAAMPAAEEFDRNGMYRQGIAKRDSTQRQKNCSWGAFVATRRAVLPAREAEQEEQQGNV